MPSQSLDVDLQIGIVESKNQIKIGACFTKTIDKILIDKSIQLLAINTTEVPITIEQNTLTATFTKFTTEQARSLIPLEPKLQETD